MRTPFFLSVMTTWTILIIGSVEAIPTIPRPALQVNATEDAAGPTDIKVNVKSRQLVVNPNVPTGATGLSGNSASRVQGPIQSLTLLQQLANSGNTQVSIAAELEAQKQEKIQLQNQQQQMGALANVQAQQDQISTTQAAIANQSHMVNGQHGAFSPATSENSMILQQKLEAQKQQLLMQQQLLQQAIKPEAHQANKLEILVAQLLREPAWKRPQLCEQIKQTQTKVEAQKIVNPQSMQIVEMKPTRSEQELRRYMALLNMMCLGTTTTNGIGAGDASPMTTIGDGIRTGMMSPSYGMGGYGYGDSSILAIQLARQQQIQQLLMLQRQQQLQVMMFQQQMAMMNPFAAMF